MDLPRRFSRPGSRIKKKCQEQAILVIGGDKGSPLEHLQEILRIIRGIYKR